MSKLTLFTLFTFFLFQHSYAGDKSKRVRTTALQQNDHGKTSRLNLKIQPAAYWATMGGEAEFVVSPKFSLALFGSWKYARLDRQIKRFNKEDYMKSGISIELIGRYYITISKKHLSLAPLGFYVQGSVGYNSILYFDGSVRPFSLNTRFRPANGGASVPSDFTLPNPLVGGIAAGYQIDLLRNKIIANLSLGTQINSDSKGLFLTLYVSPSIGMMF